MAAPEQLAEPVWPLYAKAQGRCGGISTLLEWDAQIPPYEELLAELGKAKLAREGVRPQSGAAPVAGAHAIPTPIDHALSLADA